LQIGTRLRRSLLNDISQTSIVAVELDGAVHEFSRLPGVSEGTVLDILLNFQKVALRAPFLKNGEMLVVSFFFSGPGAFYAKDIPWPDAFECRNPGTILVSLSSAAKLHGHLLLLKHNAWSSFQTTLGKPLRLNDVLITKIRYQNETRQFFTYPWFSIGFPSMPVERVGFRIDSVGPLSQQSEILILEILTNGNISPRQALRDASILLVHKFSTIADVILPLSPTSKYSKVKNFFFEGKNDLFFNEFFNKQVLGEISKQTLYNFFDMSFSSFREPIGLDLGNLELVKEDYDELRKLGFQTLGQLLERLIFDSKIFSPSLKKQRQRALFRLGFFFILNFCSL
jgi:DNA-directed RNA polymerase alpha subunit